MCPFSFQSPHVSGLKKTRSVGAGPGVGVMVGVWDGTGVAGGGQVPPGSRVAVAVGEVISSGIDVDRGVMQPARQISSKQSRTI